MGMGNAHTNPMGVEWFGLAMGLGFVLSFGYWCTDFLVIQRAMAAHSMSAARRVPLIAALPKMLFPILVILPGLIAVSLPTGYLRVEGYPKGTTFAEIQAGTVKPVSTSEGVPGRGLIPPKMDAAGNAVRDSNGNVVLDYDLAIPKMLLRYFPAGLLGLGLTALLASFMSGMAGNVTAFNTVWTYDIYQAHIRPGASDAHYLRIGRITTVAGIALSVLAAYMATRFNNIMDMLQLIFAFVNAPLFATFLLGMFWKRTTGHGAFYGLLSGTLAAALHHGMTLPVGDTVGIKGGWLGLQLHQYQSDMAQNFWTAIFAWTTCFVVTILISLMTRPREEKELAGLVYSLTPRPNEEHLAWYARPAALGIGVLILVAALNIIFR
jgi:SSS family solute:Na+ symporter